MLNHFMVDLETRGTVAGCAIVSVGVVAFDPYFGELAPDAFYSAVNLKSCLAAGLRIDDKTTEWWSTQTYEAKQVLTVAGTDYAPRLDEVLMAMQVYMANYAPFDAREVWGNGSDFDNAILQHAYYQLGKKPCWSAWKNRCYRTIKAYTPDLKIDRTGLTHHNAKDDAIAQAKHLIEIYRQLGWAQQRPTAG